MNAMLPADESDTLDRFYLSSFAAEMFSGSSVTEDSDRAN
jgi:hypothetical protein